MRQHHVPWQQFDATCVSVPKNDLVSLPVVAIPAVYEAFPSVELSAPFQRHHQDFVPREQVGALLVNMAAWEGDLVESILPVVPHD
eukprot:CAMPEP_0181181208 /NCGR_PEP_ID=MMETSP1096-20121128/7212_1 /TAXON_ID=156174 ORGANISM="Chrysochromulina ericina, Strain CCMP281" /NCGR_SAMPLE_ID=MMETSP1096 /ASSEMBLY_ACC=CAM_ASM_000453 /LENGTH=85 /DNA_ID=CAMNT_0023269691 /DNA_START=386 /DNA_END=640 /DNA_ORIENTATION=-